MLSVQELAEVWCACGSDDFGHIVKLLLLSGFRRQEIGDLSWTEVHLGERLIKLPGERVKNKHAHAIWPSDQSLAILTSIPASKTRNLVFGRGGDGYGGWGAAKAALDKRINEARARAGLEPIAHWTLHNLRRSFSTRANELGLGPPWLIKACLNHVTLVAFTTPITGLIMSARCVSAGAPTSAGLCRPSSRPCPCLRRSGNHETRCELYFYLACRPGSTLPRVLHMFTDDGNSCGDTSTIS